MGSSGSVSFSNCASFSKPSDTFSVTLQATIDSVAAGCLFAVFQPGEGHGFADTLAELLLGQAQVQPPLLDIFSQKDVFQGCVSSSAMNDSIIPYLSLILKKIGLGNSLTQNDMV